MRGRGRKRLPEGHERLSAQPAERSYRRGDDLLGERLHVMLKLRHALLGHVAASALYGDGQRRHVVFGFRVRRPHPRRPLEPSIHVLRWIDVKVAIHRKGRQADVGPVDNRKQEHQQYERTMRQPTFLNTVVYLASLTSPLSEPVIVGVVMYLSSSRTFENCCECRLFVRLW